MAVWVLTYVHCPLIYYRSERLNNQSRRVTMNGVNAARYAVGWPATTILRLIADRPVPARQAGGSAGEEVVLEAVRHPPRVGEVRSIGALMPEVLAKYGVGAEEVQAVDLLA